MRLIFTLSAVTILALPAWTANNGDNPLEEQARSLAQQFVGQLKPKLKQAMADGGPTHAIGVCADEAPKIADSLSAESGWQVRRVSLKFRNASRATPDSWEQQVLWDFDARQVSGEKAADINFGETVGDNYRYMQAQGVEGVCLVCHGESLAAPVAETLQKYYPDDLATGYSMGQVRGAISLSKNL
jgi:hypothetical protein